MSPTVLNSLADLPKPETPAQEKHRRIQEKRNRDRAQRERDTATVTHLDPPVQLVPGVSRTVVVGVASDASPEVKREYGVAV